MEEYHTLYVSPHLDDVTFSCGGQIAAQTRAGKRVLVVTIMAGDAPGELTPLAREMHEKWGPESSAAFRRIEDKHANEILGADSLHETGVDAIYRCSAGTHIPLYPRLKDLFGPVSPQDPALFTCMEILKKLPEARRVIVPLGVGGHVDHHLVRQAAEKVWDPLELWHYEDFPYTTRFMAARKLLWPPWRWYSKTIPLSPEDMETRYRASIAYASQIQTLMYNASFLENKMKRYARRVGGERLWHRKKASRTHDAIP